MTLPIAITPGDPGHIDDHEEAHELLGRLDGQTTFTATGVSQGLLADRPAAAASNEGLIYHATDVPATFYSDGSTWTQWALAGDSITWTGIHNHDEDVFFGSGRPWYDVMHEDYGATGDGTTDDTAAIQAAIDDLSNGGTLYFPEPSADYRITSTLLFENLQGVRVVGSGAGRDGCELNWDGSASGNPIRIFGCRDCTFENLYVTASTQIGNAVQIETRSGVNSTHNVFRRVYVQGNVGGVDKGFVTVEGTNGDKNNDFMTFYDCHVDNFDTAAWSFEHSQSKGHKLDQCGWNTGPIGISTNENAGQGGSFVAHHCFGGNTTTADFKLGNPNDYIQIIGGNFEGSARLLETGGPGTARFPILIQGVRWSILGLEATNNRAIVFQYRGPLVLLNNSFTPATASKPLEIFVNTSISAKDSQLIAIGNHFASTHIDPFTGPVDPAISWGNTIDRNDGNGVVRLDQELHGDVHLGSKDAKLSWTAGGTFDVGIAPETGSATNDILSIGVNDTRFGDQEDASQGGFLRFDQRSGESLFQFFGRPGGGALAKVLDIDNKGALTYAERSDTPSNPSSGSEARTYVKDDKFIIQFNDGGTVRYKYLDLTGTGASWVHTTTAP